ncbi:MAG: metal ABC transporter permease [Proteobacteria bacterium]|nr:metal ABC transporter permease [Pseudomonadota bacterium]
MIDSFFISIIIVALMASLITAPLGCIGLWNGLAFFGETLAHASLLGVCISVLLHLPYAYGAIAVCLVIAYFIGTNYSAQSDVSLAVISSTCLSVSILIISVVPQAHLSPDALLFGDLLGTNLNDIWLLASALLILTIFLIKYWSAILITSFDADLAHVQGYPSKKVRLLMLFAYATAMGIVMKLLGALFAPALTIIPAAAAYCKANRPSQMIAYAILISCFSSLSGIGLSFYFDFPVGPTIICLSTIILVILKIIKK